MAIHIGLRRAGWAGLLVAGSCFILPAVLITLACAWFYVTYARLPQLQGILYGIKPVVLAIVVQAIWRLGRTAMRTPAGIGVGAAALAASLSGLNELVVLFGAGVLMPVLRRSRPLLSDRMTPSLLLAPPIMLAAPPAAATAATGVLPIFLVFAKIGALLYGSGYVLLAFLRADLVERWGWLTEAQLLDAIAVGQFTPGPLFSTATFIGYVLAGGPGAWAATAGIFLPAFVFVAVSAPFVARLRRSPTASVFLDGVNAASVALMAAVSLQMLDGALADTATWLIGVGAAVVLLTLKTNSLWLIVAGGAAGFLSTIV